MKLVSVCVKVIDIQMRLVLIYTYIYIYSYITNLIFNSFSPRKAACHYVT